MFSALKWCGPRPKARGVLLTWARSSAYEDRAADYSKLAHLAPDGIVELARHYRTLAEIQQRATDKTAQQSHQSHNTINWSRSGLLTPFTFIFLTIISGAMTTAPFDVARASDCLTAPNSPAPKGSHWYYHLNRASQRKCWYMRSSEKPPREATAQTTPTGAAVSSTNAGQIGSRVAHDIDRSSGQFKPPTSAIQDPAFDTASNGSASRTASQGNVQPSALRGDASSGASGQASTTTAVIWPDPPPMASSVTPREANAAALDAPVNPVFDSTDRVARDAEPTSKVEIPMAIFPALALGLVVIGLGVRFLMKDSAAGRAQEVDNTGAVTILDDDHTKSSDNRPADEPTSFGEDDFLSFVSAVSGRGPLDRIVGSVYSANEVSGREARLAQLREDIGQRLGWAEPRLQYPSKQKVAS
jgi:hypothetical protein